MAIPVANPLNLTTDEDQLLYIPLEGTDPDSDPLDFFEIVDMPANGVLQPVMDGGIEEFEYIPAPNFSGSDSFTYRVFANGEYSETVTVNITVDPVADAPVISSGFAPQANPAGVSVGEGLETATAAAANGARIHVFHGFDQLGDTNGIYARVVGDDGTPYALVRVNTTTIDAQFNPAVAVNDAGEFVVVWQSLNQDGDGYGIVMQRVSQTGTLIGSETVVNTVTSGDQGEPDVASMADGGWMVAWNSFDGVENHVIVQRYDNAGSTVGGEVQIDTSFSFEAVDPSIARLGNGNLVVTWTNPDALDGSESGVFAQLLNINGAPMGSNFRVNLDTTDAQSGSQALAISTEEFVVAYVSGVPGSPDTVKVSRFDSSFGSRIGGELLVGSGNGDTLSNVSLVALPDGGFVVGWQRNGEFGSDYVLQRMDFLANPVGAPVHLNAGSGENQSFGSLAWVQGQVMATFAESVPAAPEIIRTQVFDIDPMPNQLTEGTPSASLLPMVSISDVDSDNISSMQVSIKGGFADGDYLTVNTDGTSLLATGGGSQVTVIGSGTMGEYADVLSSLQLTVLNGASGGRNLQISVTTADGTTDVINYNLKVQTADQNVAGTSFSEDLIGGNGNDTLEGGVGYDTISGNGGNDSLNGGGYADVLYGGIGDDTLNGGFDADVMYGGAGSDVYVVNNVLDEAWDVEGAGTDVVYASVSYTLASYEIENLVLTGNLGLTGAGNGNSNEITGNNGNNLLLGHGGYDLLDGGLGNDTLDGGTDYDTLRGGQGDDVYIINAGDTVVEYFNAGVDEIRISDTSYALELYVENLTLLGSGNLKGWGNVLNNVITGQGGNNELFGGDGHDTLYGNAGRDTLYGGTGMDQMYGGSGNDTYYVDDAGDVVTENSGEGVDTVHALADFTLGDNVEHVIFYGENVYYGVGNALGNRMTGGISGDTLNGMGGNDTLSGASGGDSLTGGAGFDQLFGGSGWDTLNGGNGKDTLFGGTGNDLMLGGNDADFVYGGADNDGISGDGGNDSLFGEFGNDTINGNSGADRLEGGDNDDLLYGDADDDTLAGGNGADTLFGGTGNDVYVLGSELSDVLIESPGEGIDTIEVTGTSYSMTWSDIENLTAFANDTETLLLGGDGADNVIRGVILSGTATFDMTGGGGNDTLIGAAGADTLAGGLGDDVYDIGDGAGDVLFEDVGEGMDTVVVTGVNYTLALANIENLTGRANNLQSLTLTGDGSDNVITGEIISGTATFSVNGGTGHDAIDGAAGNDSLNGDDGDDFIFGAAGDDSMTGGIGLDTLAGGAGNDTLNGQDDDDVIDGSSGNDLLTGGAGADTFEYFSALNASTNVDTITDFDALEDVFLLDADGVFTNLSGSFFLDPGEFHVGTEASSASHRIVYNDATGALYYDADGSGAGTAIQFATLSNLAAITDANFEIYSMFQA